MEAASTIGLTFPSVRAFNWLFDPKKRASHDLRHS